MPIGTVLDNGRVWAYTDDHRNERGCTVYYSSEFREEVADLVLNSLDDICIDHFVENRATASNAFQRWRNAAIQVHHDWRGGDDGDMPNCVHCFFLFEEKKLSLQGRWRSDWNAKIQLNDTLTKDQLKDLSLGFQNAFKANARNCRAFRE